MKLFFQCVHCRKHVALPYVATTRDALRQAQGAAISVPCAACSQVNVLAPAAIYAKPTAALLRFGCLLLGMLAVGGLLAVSVVWSTLFFNAVTLTLILLALMAIVFLPLVLGYRAHRRDAEVADAFNQS